MNDSRTFLDDLKWSYRRMSVVFALNVPLICGILLANSGGGDTWLSWLYAVTVALGYYCLPLFALASVLILVASPLRRRAAIVATTVITVFVAYLFVDALVYRIAKFHIDLFWIEYALKDTGGFGLPVLSLLGLTGLLIVLVGLEFGAFRLARVIRVKRIAVMLALAMIASLAFSQIVHLIAYEWNNQRITALTPHFPLYMPVTSHSNASTYREMMPWVDAHARATMPEHESLTYPLEPLRFDRSPATEPLNIVVIMLESWRYDTMNAEVSPNMHALGEKSTVFLDHLSSGNQTTCGVFGFFYGLHATYWTAVKANSSAIDNPVWIDAVQDNGYAVGVFAKSRFKRHKIQDTVFRGITVHEDFKGKNNARQDVDLNNQAIAFVEEQVRNDRPYMLYAFYKSTHAPYEYPKDQAVFKGGEQVRMGFTSGKTDPGPHLQHYRNAVHYVDSLVGELLDRLEALGQMDNTVIIITTDHGEAFNDTGANYWGHGTSYMRYQTGVPLVIYDPNRAPATVAYRTAHVDIVPTIMSEYFGCLNDPADYSNGRSLFEVPEDDRPIVIGSYTNHAYVIGEDVYEIFPVYTKKYKLYDTSISPDSPRPDLIRTVAEEITRFGVR